MPKIYTIEQKDDIRRRLKCEAVKCLRDYGVKKTTVDELVRRVNIPKGTFYLFYESKELLLFEVIMDYHNKIDRWLLDEIKSLEKLNRSVTIDELTDVIYQFYMEAESSFVLRLLTTDDIDQLMKKLPRNILEKHVIHDEDNINLIITKFGDKNKVNLQNMNGAFRGVFFSMLFKDQMPPDFRASIKLMIRGLVMQIL